MMQRYLRSCALGLIALAVFSLAANARAGQNAAAAPGMWFGVIVNGTCDADKAYSGLPECTQKNVPGATPVLYDETIRHIYTLDPQAPALGLEGESVTVQGTLDGDTINVVLSLQIVQSSRFGNRQEGAGLFCPRPVWHAQTLDTLKGPKGTVLLFFRSADW